MDGHVITNEQEVVRARASANLTDPHEHQHQDLHDDRVEVGRADEEPLPDRMEPTVREGQDEMFEHRSRNCDDHEPSREQHRAIRLDESSGEERKAGADHQCARPSLGATRQGDEAR